MFCNVPFPASFFFFHFHLFSFPYTYIIPTVLKYPIKFADGLIKASLGTLGSCHPNVRRPVKTVDGNFAGNMSFWKVF